ncbi:Vinexin, partial [Ophiophagus hannah]
MCWQTEQGSDLALGTGPTVERKLCLPSAQQCQKPRIAEMPCSRVNKPQLILLLKGLPPAEQHFQDVGEHPSFASRGSSFASLPHHSRAGVSMEALGLRLDDFIPSNLQKSPSIRSGSLTSPRATSTPQSKWNTKYYRVPVIRNCGSNTLNFEFHDTTPRQVYNGISQPWKTTQQSSANNWYPTWPAKEIRPLKTEPAHSPYLAGSVNYPTVNGVAQPSWSATWTKDGKRKEKRWVKYDGIGPVDESGMPLASRSDCLSHTVTILSPPDHDPPELMKKNQPPLMTSSSSSRQKNGLDW